MEDNLVTIFSVSETNPQMVELKKNSVVASVVSNRKTDVGPI